MTEDERVQLSARMNAMPRERLLKIAASLNDQDRKRISLSVVDLVFQSDDVVAFERWWHTLSESELAYLKLLRRGCWHIRREGIKAEVTT